jgi:hypothetical protein
MLRNYGMCPPNFLDEPVGMRKKLRYPNGAEFAFTILDDTDDSTLSNTKPVYDLLHELGVHTTKTVWALDTTPENKGPYFYGQTLADPAYLDWIRELARNGFEIASHNATMGSSIREDSIKALDFIEQEVGQKVRLHCNHGQNKENLFWGYKRYNSPLIRRLLELFTKYYSYPSFEGENPSSPYYWGDIASNKLSYLRAFAFRQLNGMHIPPGRPFSDSRKLTGPLFFNTTDAPTIGVFNKLVNPGSIDQLRKQNGWAIISTHIGKGFYWKNQLNKDFTNTMKYMASLPGWFVPVSEMLDFLKQETGSAELTGYERFKMESMQLIDRIKGRIHKNSYF